MSKKYKINLAIKGKGLLNRSFKYHTIYTILPDTITRDLIIKVVRESLPDFNPDGSDYFNVYEGPSYVPNIKVYEGPEYVSNIEENEIDEMYSGWKLLEL